MSPGVRYPWRFMGFILLSMLVPKLYELTSVFWVGRISLDALSITEQFEFVSVSMEVVSETATLGVLALVARRAGDAEHVRGVVRLGLLTALTGAGVLTLTVLFCTEQFVRLIDTPPAIAALTRRYLVLRSLALPLDAMALVLLVAIKALGRGREALVLVTLGVLAGALLDIGLVSDTSVSLHLGIPGLALSQVLGKLALLLLAGSRFIRIIGRGDHESFGALIVPFFAVGMWTGLDSLVRNLGYLGQLSVLNLLGADMFGGYGLAMTVMWTTLVPVLALGEGTSVAVGHMYGQGRHRDMARIVGTSAALGLAYMACCAWSGGFVLRPVLAAFSTNPILVDHAARTMRWLIGPYLCLTLSICIKSLFFGTGRTRYVLVTSLLTNTLLIAPGVLFMRAHPLSVHFEGLMGLLGVVMGSDLLLTVVFAIYLLRGSMRKGIAQAC